MVHTFGVSNYCATALPYHPLPGDPSQFGVTQVDLHDSSHKAVTQVTRDSSQSAARPGSPGPTWVTSLTDLGHVHHRVTKY